MDDIIYALKHNCRQEGVPTLNALLFTDRINGKSYGCYNTQDWGDFKNQFWYRIQSGLIQYQIKRDEIRWTQIANWVCIKMLPTRRYQTPKYALFLPSGSLLYSSGSEQKCWKIPGNIKEKRFPESVPFIQICTESQYGLFWAETHPPSSLNGNPFSGFCVTSITD